MTVASIYNKNVLVTPPSVEPVTLAEAKEHLRVYTTDDDAYITALIIAGREWVENDLGRKLITQTWNRIMNGFPGGNCIDLPFGNLASVTHVKYYDTAGDQQTFTSDDYIVSTSETIGKIVLTSDSSWPDIRDDVVDSVEVQFVTGYGDTDAVPKVIEQTVLLMVGQMYENREPTIVGTTASELPLSLKAMLSPYRLDLV